MLLCVFHRQLSGDGFKSAFGDHGNGSRNAGNRIIGESPRDTHDAAAGLLRLHLFHRKLSDVNETEKVSRYERAKVVRCIVCERLHHKGAGIRDHRINRAELLDRKFCNFLRGFKLTYLAVDQREMVGRWKLARFCRFPGSPYHVVTACEKHQDDSSANALRRSCYNNCLGWIVHSYTAPKKFCSSSRVSSGRSSCRKWPQSRLCPVTVEVAFARQVARMSHSCPTVFFAPHRT